MRLICPNCGAQYEVADDVIPDDGRDVQCSNCGTTWFEKPGASSIEDAFADIPQPEDEQPLGHTAEDWHETEVAEPNAATAEPEAPATPERQQLDPAIADILREEAAREAEARRIEAQSTLETQAELGLSQDPPARANPIDIEAERRMALLKGEKTEAAAGAAAATRREMLPDIEEINSSLRSNSERDYGEMTEASAASAPKASGFRRGFLGVLLILIVALLIYIYAPKISALIPAAAGTLDTYVAQVDALRLWLDETMKSVLQAITPQPE